MTLAAAVMQATIAAPSGGGDVLVVQVETYRQRVRAVAQSFVDEVDGWEQAGHLPAELWQRLGEAGLFRDRWQEGPTQGLPFARVLTEELALLCGGAALAVSLHSELFVHALVVHGAGSVAPVRDAALDGHAIGCVALTEPRGGSDLLALETSCQRTPHGWRVTGEKVFTTNLGTATHALVLARNQDAASHTMLLVDLTAPGVTRGHYYDTLGVRSTSTGSLKLDALLPPDANVGPGGAGMLVALRLLDYERLAACAGLLSAADYAMSLAVARMRDRRQFGQRVLDHQAMRHRAASHWVDLAAARALVDKAYVPTRSGHPSHHDVAAAKLLCGRVCGAAADFALQAFGGLGFTTDVPLERIYRDMRLTRIGGGTDEMMLDIVAAAVDSPNAAASTELARLAARSAARKLQQPPLER
ncbi:MAG: acyl-CoA dehydrogenase [Actinobacteria bacterium]|nr:acyl-CoA dehydrogenase [Actinomycetota bacterium]